MVAEALALTHEQVQETVGPTTPENKTTIRTPERQAKRSPSLLSLVLTDRLAFVIYTAFGLSVLIAAGWEPVETSVQASGDPPITITPASMPGLQGLNDETKAGKKAPTPTTVPKDPPAWYIGSTDVIGLATAYYQCMSSSSQNDWGKCQDMLTFSGLSAKQKENIIGSYFNRRIMVARR